MSISSELNSLSEEVHELATLGRVGARVGGGVRGHMAPDEEPQGFGDFTETRTADRLPLQKARKEFPWAEFIFQQFLKSRQFEWKDPSLTAHLTLDTEEGDVRVDGEVSFNFKVGRARVFVGMNIEDGELSGDERTLEDFGRDRTVYLEIHDKNGFTVFDNGIGQAHMAPGIVRLVLGMMRSKLPDKVKALFQG
tara:strand:+ start:1233 stop:1814 length:582 start_codon:yes stop_codon:yes gene_type:complete